MEKSIYKIKPIKYIFLFFFFLFWNLIIAPFTCDEMWNYGFAHNIATGLVPYKDFNMVITPLYPMLMALPLIFKSDILIMHIINIFMILGIFYLTEKILNKNSIYFLLILIFPISITFPSYNLFLLFLFLLIIYFEKNNKSDYLIGFLYGLLFLTKQSVGGIVALTSIYYLFKDKKKFFKRLISLVSVGIIFLLYLIINNNLFEFFDLCLFGLFDFGEKNTSKFNILLVISLMLLVFNILAIRKDKANIYYYYLLTFFSIVIPLFDFYHLQIFVYAFVLIFLLNNKFNFKNKILNYKMFFNGIFVGACLLNIYFFDFNNLSFPNQFKYIKYRAIPKSYNEHLELTTKKIDEYSDEEIIFLSQESYLFRLITDQKIGHIDLINSGNWGYNGSEKIHKYVVDHKDAVIFLNLKEQGKNKQTDQNILEYVINNGKEIDSFNNYIIYKLGELK